MEKWKELKILYVEDDEETRISLERFLKRRFGRVFLAEDGEQGLVVFEQESPDICIVDILLPGINGLDMISQMKMMGKDCKYLITSTVGDAGTILSAVNLNINNYIVKPIDTADLEHKLNTIASDIMASRKKNDRASLSALPDKGEKEEEIRRGVISIMKDACGRGPQNVTTFISGESIEINLYGVLSKQEKTLLANHGNRGHVEEGRRMLYALISDQIAAMIHECTGITTELAQVSVDCGTDHDKLVYRVVE